MSAEILEFTGETLLDLDPRRVLQAAIDAGMSEVVIVGYDADGNDYYASSMSDGRSANWHLDRAKWRLMKTVDALEEEE